MCVCVCVCGVVCVCVTLGALCVHGPCARVCTCASKRVCVTRTGQACTNPLITPIVQPLGTTRQAVSKCPE